MWYCCASGFTTEECLPLQVETAGDCYIVSGGILVQDTEGFSQVEENHNPADSARRVMEFAKDMLATAAMVR